VLGSDHWTKKDTNEDRQAPHDGNASEKELLRFYAALPNRDKQLAMIAGLAHAGGLGINRHRMWHVVHAFLTYPPRRSA
jgi:hypothetical protein